jgi:hypothetical protein
VSEQRVPPAAVRVTRLGYRLHTRLTTRGETERIREGGDLNQNVGPVIVSTD